MDQEEPEPPEVKDIQVEFWTRQEVEHFLLKEETDSFLMPENTCEETSGVYNKSRVQFQEVLDGQHGSVQKNLHTAGKSRCGRLDQPTQEHMVKKKNKNLFVCPKLNLIFLNSFNFKIQNITHLK